MKKFIPVCVMLAVFTAAGCASIEREEKSDSARDQGDQIVRAIIAEDYPEFAAGVNDSGFTGNDEEEFIASCRKLENTYGKLKGFRYLGELQTPLLVNQLFAVKFSKQGSDKKIIEHEQLLQLIFGKENGKYKLLGMRFI